MSTIQLQLVTAQLLSSTPSSVYTTPGLTVASITAASVNNPTGSPVAVNFYRVPSAGSADDSTLIASINVPAGICTNVYALVNVKFDANTQIYASGDGCYINISGTQTV